MVANDPRDRIIKPSPTLRKSTLLMGPSGVGKTFQCGTLITGGMKVLYVSTEQKAGSIEHLNPDIWPITNFDYPKDSREYVSCRGDFWELVKFIREPGHGYDVVYVDSLMAYCDGLLRELKRSLSGHELWGAFADKCEQAIRYGLCKLTSIETAKEPVHIVGTCGVEVGQDQLLRRRWKPLIDGQKVPFRLEFWFDNVLPMVRRDNAEKGLSDFVFYTVGTEEFNAKVSTHTKLPPIVVNPNLYQLLTTITGGAK